MKPSRPSPDANEINHHNRRIPVNTSSRSVFEDRPITPMRVTYKQVAEKFGDEDESSNYDRSSPTRESNTRTMSASQRSSMNSMSRTIDPRYGVKYQEQVKSMSPSRTIGSASRQRASLNASTDDSKSNILIKFSIVRYFFFIDSATLRDNPRQDAFGPLAKDLKIQTLRTYVEIIIRLKIYEILVFVFRKAIQLLGESTFEKVYDYFVKQRRAQKTDPNLDDAKITQGLTAFVKKPSDCFLVDQLVFLELI
jgi:hypothetical protein